MTIDRKLSPQNRSDAASWVVVSEAPLYRHGSKSGGYYEQPVSFDPLEDSRHLRVVRLVDAPAEDPALDW